MSEPSDKEAVLAANQAFYDAFSSKDLRGMNLLWWQGSTSLCIHPGGKVLVGWEEIRDTWESIFNNTDSFEIDLEVIKVEIDQSHAYVVVREMVLQSSRGRKVRGCPPNRIRGLVRPVKAPSMATNIFQKMRTRVLRLPQNREMSVAQKWYLVHHHGSPIMR